MLERPDAPLLEIRTESVTDHGAIRDVVVAAFRSDAEGDLVESIRASPEYVPELALVAAVDGLVVGHVMVSRARLRNDRGERQMVMLSPLAVAPDHQRHGIGGALVGAVLERTDERGEPIVVLEGDPRYYGRFGFEHSELFGITVDLPDWAPPEAAQMMRLSAYDAHDPTLRGVVIYPDALAALG